MHPTLQRFKEGLEIRGLASTTVKAYTSQVSVFLSLIGKPTGELDLEDVRRHLRDEPVLAGPPSAGYRFGKLVRRHRAAAVGAVAGGLLLLGGIGATAWQAVRATRAEAEARPYSMSTATH